MKKCKLTLRIEGENPREVYRREMYIGFENGKMYIGLGKTLEDTLSRKKTRIQVEIGKLEKAEIEEMKEMSGLTYNLK